MVVQLPGFEVYGSIHIDKAPMTLVHTTGTMTPGAPRYRNWCKYVEGKMVRRRYQLQQPQVHGLYRAHFSAVDRWNRHTFGPTSLQHALTTKDWRLRFFLALFSACVTNAFLAGNAHRRRKSG